MGLVVGCAKEPEVGYIDNLMGPIGLMIGIGLGIVRLIAAIETRVSDLLPVDYSVNLIIAAAWSVANVKNGERKGTHLRIFNCVSGPDAPITWREFNNFNHK